MNRGRRSNNFVTLEGMMNDKLFIPEGDWFACRLVFVPEDPVAKKENMKADLNKPPQLAFFGSEDIPLAKKKAKKNRETAEEKEKVIQMKDYFTREHFSIGPHRKIFTCPHVIYDKKTKLERSGEREVSGAACAYETFITPYDKTGLHSLRDPYYIIQKNPKCTSYVRVYCLEVKGYLYVYGLRESLMKTGVPKMLLTSEFDKRDVYLYYELPFAYHAKNLLLRQLRDCTVNVVVEKGMGPFTETDPRSVIIRSIGSQSTNPLVSSLAAHEKMEEDTSAFEAPSFPTTKLTISQHWCEEELEYETVQALEQAEEEMEGRQQYLSVVPPEEDAGFVTVHLLDIEVPTETTDLGHAPLSSLNDAVFDQDIYQYFD
jgi:hypothetical protein